jgi:hypothetical protein
VTARSLHQVLHHGINHWDLWLFGGGVGVGWRRTAAHVGVSVESNQSRHAKITSSFWSLKLRGSWIVQLYHRTRFLDCCRIWDLGRNMTRRVGRMRGRPGGGGRCGLALHVGVVASRARQKGYLPRTFVC